MSARMEKVREALETYAPPTVAHSALVEVEEWEQQRDIQQRLKAQDKEARLVELRSQIDRAEAAEDEAAKAWDFERKMLKRATAAEADAANWKRMVDDLQRDNERTEAERDRLCEALDWIEAEPEDALKVQARARAALAAPERTT